MLIIKKYVERKFMQRKKKNLTFPMWRIWSSGIPVSFIFISTWPYGSVKNPFHGESNQFLYRISWMLCESVSACSQISSYSFKRAWRENQNKVIWDSWDQLLTFKAKCWNQYHSPLISKIFHISHGPSFLQERTINAFKITHLCFIFSVFLCLSLCYIHVRYDRIMLLVSTFRPAFNCNFSSTRLKILTKNDMH